MIIVQYGFVVLCSLCLFSCGKSIGWPPPAEFRAVLMDSDSTSVITSEKDKIVVNFKENGTVRQLYDISLKKENADLYSFSSASLLGAGEKFDSLYIDCKGKTDTLVFLGEAPTYSYNNEALNISFNGKEIYIASYEDKVNLVR